MRKNSRRNIVRTAINDVIIRRLAQTFRRAGLILRRGEACHVRKLDQWLLKIRLPSKYWKDKMHMTFAKKAEIRRLLTKLGLVEGQDFSFMAYKARGWEATKTVRDWIYKLCIPTPAFVRLGTV